MNTTRTLTLATGAMCVGVALTFGVPKFGDWWPVDKQGGETTSDVGSELLILRTPGWLLKVPRVTATEQFDKKFVYNVPGQMIGATVAHIRVPIAVGYGSKTWSTT